MVPSLRIFSLLLGALSCFGVSTMANDDYDDFDENDPVEDDTEDEVEEGLEADAPAAEEAAGEGAQVARKDLDEAETLTVSSKEALRRQLEEEMERFLARGGRVQEIAPDVTADPPQKPVSNYGSKPI